LGVEEDYLSELSDDEGEGDEGEAKQKQTNKKK
jgi:hypothetical protein